MFEEIQTKFFEFTNEKKWFFQFFVSILLSINNSACFCFAIFSIYMKEGGFGYTQSEVNVVSTVGVLLSYFSLPTGYLYDNYGPKVTILVGTIINVSGWFGMFLIFYDLENPLLSNSVVLMSVVYGISQFSASFYETGSVLTNLKSFSCYQGRVVLIQKTFMGLGVSIVAQLHIAFFSNLPGIAPFFAFLCIFSAVSGILGVGCVALPTPETRCVGLNVEDPNVERTSAGESKLFLKPFRFGTGVLLFAVFYVLVVTLVENYFSLGEVTRFFIGFFSVLLCLSFLIMTFITPSYRVNIGGYRGGNGEALVESPGGGRLLSPCEDLALYKAVDVDSYGGTGTTTDVVQVEASTRKSSSFFIFRETGPIRLNRAPLTTNLKHREIWLLWWVCFASWSSMTLVSSNSGQIYQALDYGRFEKKRNTVYVSIFGVASSLGRIVVGLFHPRFHKEHIFIGSLLIISPFFNMLGLPLFLLMPASLLFLPFLIVGFSAGVSWGSTVLVVTSLFAGDNCGKHYSWLYTAGMLSPIVFNIGLFGPFYDYFSRQQHQPDNSCEGVVCVVIPFVLCTVFNLLAVPAARHLCDRVTQRQGAIVDGWD